MQVRRVRMTTERGQIFESSESLAVVTVALGANEEDNPPTAQEIKEQCLEVYQMYPEMLDHIDGRLTERQALQMLMWLREYGNIHRLEFSVLHPDEAPPGIEHANDLLYEYRPKPLQATWRKTKDLNGHLFNDYVNSKPPINYERAIREFVSRLNSSKKFVEQTYLPQLILCVECGSPVGIKNGGNTFQNSGTCSQCDGLKNYGLLDLARAEKEKILN